MHIRSLALTLAAALALTGCVGAGGPADRSYTGIPPQLQLEALDMTDDRGPIVTWLERDRRFAVTVWGSRTCPFQAVELTDQDDQVTIELEAETGEACLADLAPSTSEFTRDDSSSGPLTVKLVGLPTGEIDLELE
ncbi:hypothetical protein HMPREF0063_11863 [Aeromicrobium marinum DSM 15272]|uniref:Lipoprotein n=1 Tax=Aeromicrobium marinum DSM 15272 TaxID=585531 RepID=E2SDS7_9ACTN|nr:hypothetical protein [Aeromicrobium marinum]EFQ82654.1 hypothetical protein HMPREF0063_11863 [Aeromicrobium marinum DSM 15272]